MTRGRGAAGPIRAFHGSPAAGITAFRPLSHHGGGETWLYEVELDLRSPRAIRDLPAGPRPPVHSPLRLLEALHYTAHVLSADERATILAAAAEALTGALVATLAGHGIDGLRYRNRFEDPSSTSWVVLRPDQVRIVAVTRH